MHTIVEDEDDRAISTSTDSTDSIGSRIDDLEETLERKLRVNSGTSRLMRCVGGLIKIVIKWYLWLRDKDHTD